MEARAVAILVGSPSSAPVVYVSDAEAGLRRRRAGRGFVYLDQAGKRIGDPAKLHWVRSLVIPPAWEAVWISPIANGHLLVTGRDQRGRKQYIYHPAWRAEREGLKYDRLIEFAGALPRIRERVAVDLRAGGLARRRVLALVVRLLELTLIRIGNVEYLALNEFRWADDAEHRAPHRRGRPAPLPVPRQER